MLSVPFTVSLTVCTLQPDCGWEVDLSHLESLIDDKTMAIVVSNPSFPTGTIYSEGHLREILTVAERHLIPIISDECETASVGPGACDSSQYTVVLWGGGGGGRRGGGVWNFSLKTFAGALNLFTVKCLHATSQDLGTDVCVNCRC